MLGDPMAEPFRIGFVSSVTVLVEASIGNIAGVQSPSQNGATPDATRASSTPVPDQIDGFASGRPLSASETAALAAAGVPMR
jgi:hypothetical protein